MDNPFRERQFTICLSSSCFLNMRDSVHYLDRAIVIVLKTKRTYFVTPSVNSTSFLQFGQNMLSKSELLSLSEDGSVNDAQELFVYISRLQVCFYY